MVQHYPVALRLEGKRCLVVGGGEVAYRKVNSLRECGAAVRVVSPELDEDLASLAAKGMIEYQPRAVEEDDLDGVFLVIGATDRREVNRTVSLWANARGIPVNIVDQPEDCSFIVPAVHRVGSLTLTVHTDGKSPALAAKIRREWEQAYPAAYGVALEWLWEVRMYLFAHQPDISRRRGILLEVVEGAWLPYLLEGQGEQALQRLMQYFPEWDDAEELWDRLQRIWEEMRDGESNTDRNPGKRTGPGADTMGCETAAGGFSGCANGSGRNPDPR